LAGRTPQKKGLMRHIAQKNKRKVKKSSSMKHGGGRERRKKKGKATISGKFDKSADGHNILTDGRERGKKNNEKQRGQKTGPASEGCKKGRDGRLQRGIQVGRVAEKKGEKFATGEE